MSNHRTLLLLAVAGLMVGCGGGPPLRTVERLELNRFMGDWYVIASIPTPFEKEVYNGIESYRLAGDGTVATTFTFNKGGFEGPRKVYRARGFVRNPDSNAVWGMQFFWPFKAEYRVVFLDEDYTVTVIGRTRRDYVWIMARAPSIPAADYDRLLNLLTEEGYDVGKLIKVPHAPAGGSG